MFVCKKRKTGASEYLAIMGFTSLFVCQPELPAMLSVEGLTLIKVYSPISTEMRYPVRIR